MKFADTNFLVALLNPNDQWHPLAKAAASTLDEQLITTMWVLVEEESLHVTGITE